MNSQLFVTADIVQRNPQLLQLQQLQQLQQQQQQQLQQQLQQQQQQLVINDVFEIPAISTVSTLPHSQVPVNLNMLSSAFTNTDNMNFIKSINHTAMTDVMNQLAKQPHKTPSVGTKQSDVSFQVPPTTAPPEQSYRTGQMNIFSKFGIHNKNKISKPSSSSPVIFPESGINDISNVNVNGISKKHIPKHVSKNTLNKKVIIEEEDIESAIDYDDDDTVIKKTKLSLFQFAKDITFNLIFAIPFLQKARLQAMLRDSTLAINQIERIFDEFKDRFTQFDLESIKKYICEDGIRDQLNFILESGFNKILSDGVIDVNDAPQFNQLVYYIIKSFNDINQGKVYRFYVSREHVMLLLHFVLKSVFSLTLKGQEEQMALGLLDTSFKLVQLEVLPIVSKRWYHRFRICKSAKQIEDIIE